MVETKTNHATVNLEVLDIAVARYLLEEELVDNDAAPPTVETELEDFDIVANNALRSTTESVRHCVEAGDIEQAIATCTFVSPAVLQDQRLKFRLQKQKFIELLRQDTAEGRKQALSCLRQELIPSALHANPEAYGELRRALLLLIYGQADEPSPVKEEWSARARSDLAGMLARTLRQATGVRFPQLTLLLRYLAFTHCLLRAQAEPVGGTGQALGSTEDREVEELLGKLLGSDRDPPPLPPDQASYPSQGFAEADIQSLKEAVALSRQEAVEALRHSAGDLRAAFLNELGALHLNTPLLDDLVMSYAAQRDLLRVGSSRESSPGYARALQQQLQLHADENASRDDMDIDRPGWPRDSAEEEACGALGQGATPACARGAQERRERRRDCGRQDVTAEFVRQPSKSPPKKVPRWRGRADQASPHTPPCSPAAANATLGAWPSGGGGGDGGAHAAGAHAADLIRQPPRGSPCRKLALLSAHSSAAAACEVDPRHELLRRVRYSIEAERFDEAVEDVQGSAPGCLETEPDLAFELHLARFHARAAAGDAAGAVAISRAALTPITRSHAHLVPQLKAALATLVAGPGEARSRLQPYRLSQLAGTCLHEALGIQDPKLVQLLRVLLGSHRAWLKLQRCKDRFEPLLRLDALKSAPGAPSSAACSGGASSAAAPPAAAAAGSSGAHGAAGSGRERVLHELMQRVAAPPDPPDQARRSRGAGDDSDEEEDADEDARMYSEEDVVLVMEFTGLGRAPAIQLLRRFGGDTEAVLAHVYP